MTNPVSAHDHEGHDCNLDFKMNDIDGNEVDLEDYEGKVVLIVNTASKCGLTRQYSDLEKLYGKYKDQGLVVLGFPCNQFGGQEPGSDADVKKFCSTKYDVSFPMMSKVKVNGDDAAPIYKKLTGTELEPAGDGEISWNFEKFVIDREGQAVARFSPRTIPLDEDLVKVIEAELAK
ncbi:glutathione peroxidase [Rubripirellula obstinata]